MSGETVLPSDEEIRFLPESPVVYLSMMRTVEGVPRGTPIWSSFDNKSTERSMENESMASTFLSLAKSISDIARANDGKVIRLQINKKTYNIYIPHAEDEMQVCFVIVFEESETILVKDKYKVELVNLVTESLRSISDFQQFLDDDTKIRLDKGDSLYDEIYHRIVEDIKTWDRKRVNRLKQKREELQRQQELEQEIEELEQEMANDQSPSDEIAEIADQDLVDDTDT